MDPVLVAANWKMYKTTSQALEFFDRWAEVVIPPGREVAFFPPFPLLGAVRKHLPPGQALGAQNAHESDEGAFTGEVSCALLKDVGCTYVLVGHSERRHVFGETDERLAAKVKAAFRHGLRPVLCVGEKLEEREAGRTLDVVLGQLAAGLSDPAPAGGFDVAYEPVWAIGTGRVARPEDAAEVHRAILDWLEGHGAGRDARILYGGSVKPDNASALLATEGVHGLLVGGASLDPKSFEAIVRG
jgi:triosephosphate isomerase (TIM)